MSVTFRWTLSCSISTDLLASHDMAGMGGKVGGEPHSHAGFGCAILGALMLLVFWPYLLRPVLCWLLLWSVGHFLGKFPNCIFNALKVPTMLMRCDVGNQTVPLENSSSMTVRKKYCQLSSMMAHVICQIIRGTDFSTLA